MHKLCVTGVIILGLVFCNNVQADDNRIVFGSYEQDGIAENGLEPIEWEILKEEGEKVLIISKVGIDAQPYNRDMEEKTWENSSLRKWLNEDFYNAAFSLEEQDLIVETKVETINWNQEKDSVKEITDDRIFLLSIEELEELYGDSINSNELKRNEKLCVKASKYAALYGAETVTGEDVTYYPDFYFQNDIGNCWWWLRTSGVDWKYAMCVDVNGSINSYGYIVNYVSGCIRPVLWIKKIS